MQKFLNPETGLQHYYEDDVVIEVIDENGNDVYVFFDPHGNMLDTPKTLIPLPDGWTPPEPQPYIPQSVTPAQGLMALYELKTITEDDILAVIGTIADATLRYQAQIAYKKATAWERASVTMQTLAGLLALTEPDLDELFTKAVAYTNL